MQDLKLLLLQTDIIWNDPIKNRELLEIKIRNHVEDHHLVILPETFTTGFPKFPEITSETIDGPTFSWMRKVAGDSGAVIAGSIILEKDDRYTNSLIWMRPDGTYEEYAKRHIFTMANEGMVIDKGRTQKIVELNGWKINLQICYDLRFPVWSKNRYFEDGSYAYDLLIYVANWPAVRSYPWNQLLITRAIENLSYVAAVNRVGNDPYGVYYSGDSAIIDPKGHILSQGEEQKERALSAILSHTALTDFRKKFNVGADWDNFSIQTD
jgi:predicted amidohydrolase